MWSPQNKRTTKDEVCLQRAAQQGIHYLWVGNPPVLSCFFPIKPPCCACADKMVTQGKIHLRICFQRNRASRYHKSFAYLSNILDIWLLHFPLCGTLLCVVCCCFFDFVSAVTNLEIACEQTESGRLGQMASNVAMHFVCIYLATSRVHPEAGSLELVLFTK